MKNSFLALLTILILITTSCQEPEYCDLFNHQKPSFLLVNLLDQTTKENLIFGSSASLDINDIEIHLKTSDSTYTPQSVDGILHNEDSVVLIMLRELYSHTIHISLVDEIQINYNNQFPSDTISIDYILGNCEDFDEDVPYDYNITSNTGDICFECFKEVIDILK